MNSQDLDRHITGNYGEDQFKGGGSPLGRSFFAGAAARRKGKPLNSCRCRNPKNAAEWRYGWHDEDMSMLVEEETAQ